MYCRILYRMKKDVPFIQCRLVGLASSIHIEELHVYTQYMHMFGCSKYCGKLYDLPLCVCVGG